jgi:hydrogenase expression/formation protein HypC
MCLGVPGKVIQVEPNALGMVMGKVDFGGVVKEVCLAYVPEAEIGQYVLVHAGFALNVIDEAQAQEIFDLLRQIDDLPQMDEAGLPGGV